MFANVMILEKCKNHSDVISCLKEIVRNNERKDIKNLKRIIMYLYKEIEENSKVIL